MQDDGGGYGEAVGYLLLFLALGVSLQVFQNQSSVMNLGDK